MQKTELEFAILGGGCFWCLEAVYSHLVGVDAVVSGYCGGASVNPTYEQICTGKTGHAEVVRIAFRPEVVSYREVLEVFFAIHDPTTLNRQGNDVGTQYRSVIFYASPTQKETAEKLIAELEAQQILHTPIVTELAPLPEFYQAESYHQNYFAKNPHQGYCQVVVNPKVAKFRKLFPSRIKPIR